MQVEQTDKLTAAKRWMGALPRHDFDHFLTLIHDAAERHRHQGRAEVVGEIVAWLREEAVIYRSSWAESVDPRASAVADEIEAKFGGRDAE